MNPYNKIAGKIKDGSNGDVVVDQYHHNKVLIYVVPRSW